MSAAGENLADTIDESRWAGLSDTKGMGGPDDTDAESAGPGSIPAKGRSAAGKNKEGKTRLKRLLSYRWIMKNMFFFLFLAALAVVYIYNGHYADKIVRDINRTNRELKELQYEYKTLKSEVMFRSKESELAKAVGPFGLKELMAPPVVLTDSSK
ncbi:MAG TPA: FtsL-like putative cell division protein [Puia sp.]|nr:FtsL-like putative cell division protein [Puia sp.]